MSKSSDLPRQGFVAVAMVLASILTAFDVRLANIGLADLRGAFGLSFDEGAWLSTFATAPQILVAPSVGWLIAVFGVKRVMTVPVALYSTVSVLIPFQHSFEVLAVLHALRAVVLGMFVGATLMIAFKNLDRRYWIFALAFYVLRIPFAQNLGLYTAGSYTQTIGWQWLYWQGALIAPMVGILFWYGAKPVATDRELLSRADWGGMALFGVALTTLYFALDQGNRLDWFRSGMVVSLMIATVFLVIVFLWHEASVAHPWAHISVLFSRNVALGFAAIACFMTTSLGSSLLEPNFLVSVTRLRPEQVGDFSAPLAIALLLVATGTAVVLVRTIKQRATLILGFSCFLVAAWLGTELTNLWALPEFRLIVVLQIFGEELVFLAAVATLFSNVNPARAVSLTAYVQVMRLICSETVATTMTTWIRQREQLHSNLIGLHVTGTTPRWNSMLASLGSGSSSGLTSADAVKRGLGVLASTVQREASVLAYIDGFWLTFAAAVAGLLVVSLMAPSPAHPLTTR
ncbi:MFS transporter [Rhizobium leguminosarum]|uniref:MFS transporter n=1 Tax=Rhizobium leguminosarum TaxID=384 RepID=UPI001030A345|nr:MFS transporter [Rhizobium leguminosarum]QIO76223.1 MFS transporter [Rhizobium leguminosarum bv. trifolii]QIO83241.1 MFS transporter [Rhizobium leguminosarum bv. trifolii]TAU16506.1 MFS transporter [Rhizobium leguminosarum]TAU34799.1 MFS transporter [Rhizobium leguminosarum]TAX44023.1 MFS transporter [Rhizobium leguminosarum]